MIRFRAMFGKGCFGQIKGARMNEPQPTPETPAKQPWVSKHVRLPRLSGKASAAWLVICFLLTAVLIPMALNLPQWIKFEMVLGAWVAYLVCRLGCFSPGNG